MRTSCRARGAVFCCAAFLPHEKKNPIDLEAGGDFLASAGQENDYYAVLKINKNCSESDVKRAYKKQSLLVSTKPQEP